jgi:hypothetical protein
LGRIESQVSLGTPEILKDILLTLDRVSSGLSLGTPEILTDKLLLIDKTISTLELGNPVITGGFREVPRLKVFNAEGFGAHIRSVNSLLDLVYELQDRIKTLELGE